LCLIAIGKKKKTVWFLLLLRLFFTSNSAAFLLVGVQQYLPPGAGNPSYTTGEYKDLEKLEQI